MPVVINELNARTYARLGQGGALFGVGLLEAIADGGDVTVLTADMGKPAGLARFKDRFPDQFVNVGIAEQNLVGMAAGLASEGRRVVASAQAAFISMRSFEQVRQYLGYMQLPVVCVGVSAGFGLTFFGNTHYAIEDIALMRTIPGLTVLSPADPGMAAKAIGSALRSGRPAYIRCTGGLNAGTVYTTDVSFEIGRAIPVLEGTQVAILSTGAVTANAVQAAVQLSASGVSTAVYDFHTIKPLDVATLQSCLGHALIVTVEEHTIGGGLGGAVAEYLATLSAHPPLVRLGIHDRFFIPGDYPYLIAQSRLDAQSIAEDIAARLVEPHR